MPAAPRPRSTFWVVSTHVLTTGFAFPILAGVAAYFVLDAFDRIEFYAALAITLGLQALGYIGGVFYSLAYLRKVAIPTNPLGCIIPSNVTFLVLVALALGWNIKHFDLLDHLGYLAALVVYYAVITAVFAIVTRNGFRQMAGFVGPRGFEVQPAVPVMPLTPPPPYEDPAARR